MIAFLLLGASFCLLLVAANLGNKRKYNLPLGPRGFPLLQNLPQLGTRPHLKLGEWVSKFGSLYTVYLAHKPALVISDMKLLRELFGNKAANGRFSSELLEEISWSGSYGIGSPHIKAAQEQKRFFMRTLTELGFQSAHRMNTIIVEQVECLSLWIETEQLAGNKLYFDEILKQCSSNITWTVVTGEQSFLGSSRIAKLVTEWQSALRTAVLTGIIFFPWLKHIPPIKFGHKRYLTVCAELREYVENSFTQHKISREEGDPARDMIDAYIDKVESCQDPESSFYGAEGWKHCYTSVLLLMIAGRDSMAIVLNWMMFYLSVYPKVQEKLQEEIDEVTGGKRNPSLDDRLRMPYSDAVILETLRVSTLSAIEAFHQLSESINFRGYRLPKGMIILPNTHYIHNDKSVWGDPENFRPSRFIEEGGSKLKDYVVAFKPGLSSCPGERVAKDMIFLFATNLLQRYTFGVDHTAVAKAEDYLTPLRGAFLCPQRLNIIASKCT